MFLCMTLRICLLLHYAWKLSGVCLKQGQADIIDYPAVKPNGSSCEHSQTCARQAMPQEDVCFRVAKVSVWQVR